MENVTGIGGFFFRSKNPQQLAEWYEKYLGVKKTPATYEEEPWVQEKGTTVFHPFNFDTDYFRDSEKMWMINFRVRDLDAIVKQLREGGNDVEVKSTPDPNGRFAFTKDPEGNPIELWEPKED